MNILRANFWFHYAGPQAFYGLAGRLWPWFAALAAVLGVWGLWLGFMVAPADAQQGEGYRIIFVHVPVLGLTFNTRISGMMTRALAPTGAMFAFLSLWTGALWGKPMWGTWWVWDARLTSELILFFLYLGYIALTSAIDDQRRGDRAGALIAIVGAINVPIIYFSVKWWNTLHQGASVSLTKSPSMAQVMLWGMLLMAMCFWLYTIALVLYRVRTTILQRESHAAWVQATVQEAA